MNKNEAKTVEVIKTNAPTEYKGKESQGLRIKTRDGEDWLNLTDKGEFLPAGYSGTIKAEVWKFKDKYYGTLKEYDKNNSSAQTEDKVNHGKCFTLLLQAEIQHSGIEKIDEDVERIIADLATDCLNSVTLCTESENLKSQNATSSSQEPGEDQELDDDIPF